MLYFVTMILMWSKRTGMLFLLSLLSNNGICFTQHESFQENPELRLYTYANQYGESAAETAVLSGSTEFVDCLFLNAPLAERPRIIQHCMLLAIRENDSVILQHLIDRHQETRFVENIALGISLLWVTDNR